MKIFRTVEELRAWSRAGKINGTVGLVPTMGALHAGHASLIRRAAAECSQVVISIFVNPTQFGPNEDYALYPRTFEVDCRLAEEAGAVAVFAPDVLALYPAGASTFVDVEGLSNRLDGGSRPGHFRGVATVVSKLLLAAEPDRAYFGQKDAAQVAVLRRMVRDLFLPVELVVCPIVREHDGLALSSRNTYLSPQERAQALVLSRAVHTVEELFAAGERNALLLMREAEKVFQTEASVKVDYIELVDWNALESVNEAQPGNLFAVAAFVGKTRLIDNAILGEPAAK